MARRTAAFSSSRFLYYRCGERRENHKLVSSRAARQRAEPENGRFLRLFSATVYSGRPRADGVDLPAGDYSRAYRYALVADAYSGDALGVWRAQQAGGGEVDGPFDRAAVYGVRRETCVQQAITALSAAIKKPAWLRVFCCVSAVRWKLFLDTEAGKAS